MLIGYAKYCKGTRNHIFVPLPEGPDPIFELVCKGCRETRGNCKEYCNSWAEELTGFVVYYWDWAKEEFRYHRIHESELKPIQHGYFSYRTWRKNENEKKRKREADAKERKSKRAKTSQDSPIWIT